MSFEIQFERFGVRIPQGAPLSKTFLFERGAPCNYDPSAACAGLRATERKYRILLLI
jgi:hypothetical protein